MSGVALDAWDHSPPWLLRKECGQAGLPLGHWVHPTKEDQLLRRHRGVDRWVTAGNRLLVVDRIPYREGCVSRGQAITSRMHSSTVFRRTSQPQAAWERAVSQMGHWALEMQLLRLGTRLFNVTWTRISTSSFVWPVQWPVQLSPALVSCQLCGVRKVPLNAWESTCSYLSLGLGVWQDS